jgi:hypothetical protein
MSGHPRIMQVALAHLEALRYPWAYEFQQILQQALMESVQAQQMMMGVQAMNMSEGMQAQQALPEGGGTPEDLEVGIVQQLAEIEGMSPEEVALALAEAS